MAWTNWRISPRYFLDCQQGRRVTYWKSRYLLENVSAYVLRAALRIALRLN